MSTRLKRFVDGVRRVLSSPVFITIAQVQYGGILQGRRILVTGGTAGIGMAIARRCLQEGAEVLITGRSEARLTEARELLSGPQGKRLCVQRWDISDVRNLNSHLDTAVELLGGLPDTLINNAGVINTNPFPQVTEENWDIIYSTNSKGTYFLTQEFCRRWLQAPSAPVLKKVINISSQGAFVGATYPYRMSKWDLAGMTAGLGALMAGRGILVNGIAPGIVRTNMQPQEMKQGKDSSCPHNQLRRHALPEEIAELAVFMLSDACNFMVGHTVVCDGGYSLK